MAATKRNSVKRKLGFDENSSSEWSDYDSDDSVNDKDYVGEKKSSTESSDSEISNTENVEDGNISRGKMDSPEKSTPSRWRKVNVASRKREKEKKRRNKGYAFKTFKGQEKPSKEMGVACKCKNKCRLTLEGKEIEIFNSFRNLNSRDQQNIYLFGRIQAIPKKRKYPKKTKRNVSARNMTFLYCVKINGFDKKVCKEEFLAIHGLQNSRKRIYNICRQICDGKSISTPDGRGKHKNRKNRLPQEQIDSVHNHIRAIPKYTSHYSRHDNPNRVYIDNDLSISSLYKDYYVPWCQEKHINPVKEDRYRRIFCTEYNIGFKLPKTDTCQTCDAYKISLESNQDNEDACGEIKVKLELHQRRAEAMQQSLKSEAAIAKTSDTKIVISFDLQQALPIPNLTVGKAFYLRKAWFYNLGVHHCNTNKGYMFTWTENIAKRGSDEICSIVLKFVNTYLHSKSKDLLVYTDNCGGQNKNWALMGLWSQLVREKRFNSIEHRFLLSGHTHLPSDRDFALIEKRKKYVAQVYHPDQWCDVIKVANRKTPFVCTKMESEDFLSFEPLLKAINKKQVTETKEPVNFSQVRCFRFEATNANIMFVKHFLNEEFKSVNIGKRGVKSTNFISTQELTTKYENPIIIAENKIQNLKQLLPFVPPIYRDFYTQLGVPLDLEPVDDEIVTEQEVGHLE